MSNIPWTRSHKAVLASGSAKLQVEAVSGRETAVKENRKLAGELMRTTEAVRAKRKGNTLTLIVA